MLERHWEPNVEALGGRQARRDFGYEAYLPARIGSEGFLLDSYIAAAGSNAELACRELNDEPPELANFETLARQLLRAESVASSRIEGLVLSHRRLAKAAFSSQVHDITAQSVLANIRALERAVELASTAERLERDLAKSYLPPVSLALAGEADRYVAGLTSWRIGDEDDWYIVFIDALFRAAMGARRFVAEISGLQERWLQEAGNPRKGSGARRLIELLPSQPILDVKTAAQLLGGSEERARLAINRLDSAGVLRRTTIGRGNRAWECVGLFDLLDRFERDLGPPGKAPRPSRAP
jgi:Fic/DOC family N-terminal